MNPVDEYLSELDARLKVRGRARRRLLEECRAHLADAAALVGEAEAVRRFGDVATVAASVDTEVASGRAVRSTAWSTLAVVAVAFSTLTLISSADPQAHTALPWAVLFFAAAQTAAISMLLAVLRSWALACSAVVAPADIALLSRRNLVGLGSAAATLVAAGGALPGRGSAPAILAGPVMVLLAAATVFRSRALVRHLPGYASRTVRSPLGDLALATNHTIADLRPMGLLLIGVGLATIAAFTWSELDHGSVQSSIVVACVQAVMAVTGFALLGSLLGLRPSPRSAK